MTRQEMQMMVPSLKMYIQETSVPERILRDMRMRESLDYAMKLYDEADAAEADAAKGLSARARYLRSWADLAVRP